MNLTYALYYEDNDITSVFSTTSPNTPPSEFVSLVQRNS